MTTSKKKMVVTGGAGFIGSNLAAELVRMGHDVHIIDNNPAFRRDTLPKEAVLHEVDMRSPEAQPIFEGADTVFHLAALPRVQYSIEYPVETTDNNISGTIAVFEAAVKGKARRIVYSASSSAYGDQPTLPLVEDMPANPKSPYGLQKYVGELAAKVWSDVYGIETVSLRYFNVYGPGLDPNGAYALVIGRFLKQAQQGEALTITGDGLQTRDFTHVRDVVRANILASQSTKVGKGEVVNIGAGRRSTILDLAKMISGNITFVPARLEPHDTEANNTKAKELLGWSPEVKLEDGIAELKQIFGIK